MLMLIHMLSLSQFLFLFLFLLQLISITKAPKGADSYSMKTITQDMASLLDFLGIEKAVFLGHDWGGEVVWKMCLFHPDRVLAVGAVCTPYTPRHPNFVSLEDIIRIYPSFAYQVHTFVFFLFLGAAHPFFKTNYFYPKTSPFPPSLPLPYFSLDVVISMLCRLI